MIPSKPAPAHVQEACELLSNGGVGMLTLMSLHGKLESGELRAVIARSGDGAAVLVLDERGSWRQVALAAGAELPLLRLLSELRTSSEGILWSEETVELEGPKLDELGYRLFERQVFTQDLSLVPLDEPDPEGLEVGPLTAADLAQSRELFARAHAMNVAGVYCTSPEAPTLERCGLAFDGFLSEKPVPSACVVVRNQGRVVGVVLCSASKEEEGLGVLLGLAVDTSERGRGLSHVLVRRAQRGLKAAGFARMLFFTTDNNAPVHRLFTADQIVSTETYRARIWLRNAPERPVRQK